MTADLVAQFDLFEGVGASGYVVDVQADLLYRLTTRMVVPLVRKASLPVLRDLTPIVEIDGDEYMLITYDMASVSRKVLRHKVGSLARYRDEIRLALDILLVGF